MGVASYLCLLLSCLAGVRSDVVLTQPASAVVKPGESYTLTCGVSGSSLSSYYSMNWVKQVSEKGLEWLAGIDYYDDKYCAPGVKGRFEVSKDSSNFYLQMKNLRPDDTATYYCASITGWHSVRDGAPSTHKPAATKLLQLGSSGAATGLYPGTRGYKSDPEWIIWEWQQVPLKMCLEGTGTTEEQQSVEAE